MMEIGSWTTSEESIRAVLEFDDPADVEDIPRWASSAISGALAGATTGAAAGPYGALIGAVAGGALGAASTALEPPPKSGPPPARPSAPPTAPRAPTGRASTPNATAALQQLAAILPALIQLVASQSKPAKESDAEGTSDDSGVEAGGLADWAEAAREGTWTLP